MLTFDGFFGKANSPEPLGDGAVLLRAYALAEAHALTAAVQHITEVAPFRQMLTRGGLKMSLTSTGCGNLGWLTEEDDSKAAIYSTLPQTLPPMPELFLSFARRAAAAAGYHDFAANACLINRYFPGAKLGLHQDKDERDFKAPIVSVSLGLPITFLFGGLQRSEPTQRIALDHGDVVVWGGATRMAFHGVLTLKDGDHPLLGRQRINLTFRKVKDQNTSI